MDSGSLTPGYALKTYRYLRIGILSATGLLAVSIAVEFFRSECLLPSISAYYYTPVRAAFVGSLMAIGLALIVLKGDRYEDLALNVAGILAPIVAVVPIRSLLGFDDCPSSDPLRLGDGQALNDFLDRSVVNNMWALIVTGILGLAVTIFVYARGRQSVRSLRSALSGPDSDDRRTLIELILFVLIAAVVAGWFVFFQESFIDIGHDVAAVGMFAALAVASWIGSRYAAQSHETNSYRNLYRAVSIAMVGSFAVIALFLRSISWWVFLAEAVEIALFGFYWAVQTIEHWYEKVDAREATEDSVIVGE